MNLEVPTLHLETFSTEYISVGILKSGFFVTGGTSDTSLP